MKTPPLALFLAGVLFGRPFAAAGEHADLGPAIYDEHADAAPQIAAALGVARKENKRALLQFGANWCVLCHRLHDLFDHDPALQAELTADYVLVLVDINEGHNQATSARYGNPANMGLPALVVLDADGSALMVKDSTEMEAGDDYDPTKVMACLKRCAPKR